MTTHFEDAWSDVIGKGWREGREQRVSDRKRDAAASMQRAAANRRYQRTANKPQEVPAEPESVTSSPPERKRRTATRRRPKPQRTEEETWGRPEGYEGPNVDVDMGALSTSPNPAGSGEMGDQGFDFFSAGRKEQAPDLGPVPTPAAPIEKPDETLGSRMEDQSEDAFPTNYTNLSSEDREEVNAEMGSKLNTFNSGSEKYEQASERGDITPEQADSAKEDYKGYLFGDSPWQPSGKTEAADTTPSLEDSKDALSPSPAAQAGFDAMKPQEPEPQPEPPRIETPASKIVEPTEEVVDAVNAPKDLGPDMKRLPADPTGKFERDAIAGEIGSQEENEPDEIDEWEKLRSKTPESDEVQPPSKEDIEEKPPSKEEKGGQGGQTFATVMAADPSTSKTQTITASSSTEDVMDLIDRVHDGDASAKSALYSSMGDVEDYHPNEFKLAEEAIAGFGPSADLAKPLTDAKPTNDDMAAALLNRDNRDGKKKR